ncbi:hypothetical protein GQ457_13G022830 [Hibiscus cannabinus]
MFFYALDNSETKTSSKMLPNGDSIEGHHPGFSRKDSESYFCPTEDEDDDKVDLLHLFIFQFQISPSLSFSA